MLTFFWTIDFRPEQNLSLLLDKIPRLSRQRKREILRKKQKDDDGGSGGEKLSAFSERPSTC